VFDNHWQKIAVNNFNLAENIGGNSRFPSLRFRSALHCGYSGVTDKDSGLE
jgi:hypothetical protein